MTQQSNDPRDKYQQDTDTDTEDSKRENTGDRSGGSQAATTGYGTGESGGQAAAPAQQGKNTPSNAGNAGIRPDEAARLSDDRTEQMSHADGSSGADDPDV